MVFPAKRFDLSINNYPRVAGFQGLCLPNPDFKTAAGASTINNSTSIPSSAAALPASSVLFKAVFASCRPGYHQNYLRIFPCHNALDPVPRRLGLRRNNRNLLSTRRFTSVDFPRFAVPQSRRIPIWCRSRLLYQWSWLDCVLVCMQRASGQFLYFHANTFRWLASSTSNETLPDQISRRALEPFRSHGSEAPQLSCRSSTESPKWEPSISSTSSMAVLPRMTSELSLHGPFQVRMRYLPLRSPQRSLPPDLHLAIPADASVFVDKLLPALDFSAAFLSTVLTNFRSGMTSRLHQSTHLPLCKIRVRDLQQILRVDDSANVIE